MQARTGVADFASEADEMDTVRPPSLPPPIPSSELVSSITSVSTAKSPAGQLGGKKGGNRTKKGDKKQHRNNKGEDASKSSQHGMMEFPNSIDMGYLSGGSQCAPNGLLGLLKNGRTQLSGYSSSGYYEPDYLNEEALPLVLSSSLSDQQSLEGPYYEANIKREPFSPSSTGSQMDHYSPYQLSQAPPPPYYKHGLHPLPEMQAFGSGGSQGFQGFSPQSSGGGGGVEVGSSGYSSFGGSPVRMMNSDETCSLGGSYRSGGGGSELSSSSHSSFSTLSSHLSSPISSTHHHGRDYSKHSYRNLRPPDLILRPHQPTYSVQMSDIKVSGGGYRRHSDEVSLRSSHSSRYSGSEYSDDMSHRHGNMGPPPPLPPPDARTSVRDPLPLPLPRSMQIPQQQDFMSSQSDMVAMTTASHVGGAYHHHHHQLGSLPLKHYDVQSQQPHLPAMPQQGKPVQPGLPMIFESHVHAGVAEDCPNMVIGNMALNANQLQQDNLLFETLSTSSSYIGLPH